MLVSKQKMMQRLNLELASLDSLNIGYIVSDVSHSVLLINYEARRILVTAKQLKSLEQVVKKLPERIALLDHVKYCSVEHKSCSFNEVELEDKVIKVFLSPIFEKDTLIGNLLTLEDITVEKANEKARDQFLAFLVHEFRTPLTAIKGNSSLIKTMYSAESEDMLQMSGDIIESSEYLLRLVNQFLDMSKLEEGRIQFDFREIDINSLLSETLKPLMVIAKDKGLELQFNQSTSPLRVVGDQDRIKQVVINMVGNALKFTEKGFVRVDVKVTDQVATVRVKDTGPGIPQDSRKGMFQKYFQASNNSLKKDSTKSTGIGLYVTKLMIEGMGGKIGLEDSRVGEGSVFFFTLDLATPKRLATMKKQNYDAAQGVKHEQVAEHQSVLLKN